MQDMILIHFCIWVGMGWGICRQRFICYVSCQVEILGTKPFGARPTFNTINLKITATGGGLGLEISSQIHILGSTFERIWPDVDHVPATLISWKVAHVQSQSFLKANVKVSLSGLFRGGNSRSCFTKLPYIEPEDSDKQQMYGNFECAVCS